MLMLKKALSQELFTQSKRAANRQLKDIKEQIEELGRVKDLKDIGSLAELNKRLKETEEWLTQFAKPSGMGRATLASALSASGISIC